MHWPRSAGYGLQEVRRYTSSAAWLHQALFLEPLSQTVSEYQTRYFTRYGVFKPGYYFALPVNDDRVYFFGVLRKIPEPEIEGIFSDGPQTPRFLQSHRIGIGLTGIDMPELSGIMDKEEEKPLSRLCGCYRQLFEPDAYFMRSILPLKSEIGECFKSGE